MSEQVFNNKYLSGLIDCYVYDWNGDLLVIHNRQNTLQCYIHDRRLKFSKKALDHALKQGYYKIAKLLCDYRTEGYTTQKWNDNLRPTLTNYRILNYFYKKKVEVLSFYVIDSIKKLDQYKLEDIYDILNDNAFLALGSMHSYIREERFFITENAFFITPKIEAAQKELKEDCIRVINENKKACESFELYQLDNQKDWVIADDSLARKLFSVLVFLFGTHFGIVRKGEHTPSGGKYPHLRGTTYYELHFFNIPKLLDESPTFYRNE
jgi:hypothetical protein